MKLANAVIYYMLKDYKDHGERVDEVLFLAVSQRLNYLEKENNRLISENMKLSDNE